VSPTPIKSIKYLPKYWTALLACLLLAACGQKGPLTLPDPAPQAGTTEAADSEADEADENDSEQDSEEQ